MTITFSISPLLKSIPEQIENICRGQASAADVQSLVHFCKSMTAAFLRVKQARKKFYFPIINRHADNLDDLALDIVAPLFRRNQAGRWDRLERFFTPVLENIKTDPTAAYVQLKRLISSHLDQELMELFSKEDPDGWKFYRNILLAPQRNPHIRIIDIQTTPYVLYQDDPSSDPWDSVDGNRPEIDLPTLETCLRAAMKAAKTTPAYIGNLLRTIKEDPRWASQVPLASLHSALKHILGITTVPLNGQEPKRNPDSFSIPREAVFSSFKIHMKNELDRVYRQPGKLPEPVLERYQDILNLYFEDLLWLGEPNSLGTYMNHKPENEILTADWNQHKHRLEYLIKKGKKYLQLIFRQN